MVPIKFVTDSAADIPRALREELGIQVLPFPIAMGNKELQDGYDFTPEEFYPTIRISIGSDPHPRPAQPLRLQPVLSGGVSGGYRCLIYTAINAKGSATYQNAVQARRSSMRTIRRQKRPFTSTSWTPVPTPWATAGRWSRGPEWPGTVRTRGRSWPISRTGSTTPGDLRPPGPALRQEVGPGVRGGRLHGGRPGAQAHYDL